MTTVTRKSDPFLISGKIVFKNSEGESPIPQADQASIKERVTGMLRLFFDTGVERRCRFRDFVDTTLKVEGGVPERGSFSVSLNPLKNPQGSSQTASVQAAADPLKAVTTEFSFCENAYQVRVFVDITRDSETCCYNLSPNVVIKETRRPSELLAGS